MKIAEILTRSDTVGGAAVHAITLSKELLRRGHEVLFLVGGAGSLIQVLENEKVQYRSLSHLAREVNPWSDLKAVWELRKVLIEFQPDIVACHSAKAGIVGRVAAWNLKLPSVYTVHGWAFTEGVPKHKALVYTYIEKILSRFGSAVIAVSNYDRELALRKKVVPPNKITTIWNGIPDVPDGYLANPKKSPPRIIMVARLDIPKNHFMLLKALTGLKALDWSLMIVGEGPHEPELRQFCQDQQLKEKVQFLGMRDDVPKLLAQAQIAVLISDYEALPLCLIEAMRAGLPVIGSDVGGIKEIIDNGKTGFLVAKGHSEDLRFQLEKLIHNAEMRVDMGKAGRQRYKEFFKLDNMVDQTLATYHHVSKI